jgi:hypothetical protein
VTNDDYPEVPDFLIIPQEVRRASWKGKKLRHTSEMTFTTKARDEDPATKQLRREMAKAEQEKKAARLAALAAYKKNRKGLR